MSCLPASTSLPPSMAGPGSIQLTDGNKAILGRSHMTLHTVYLCSMETAHKSMLLKATGG